MQTQESPSKNPNTPSQAVSLDFLPDVIPLPDLPKSDEYTHHDAGEFSGLVLSELKYIERYSRMSVLESAIWEMLVKHGLSIDNLCSTFGRAPAEVKKAVARATVKAMHVPDVGLFTVIVETFGWAAAFEHFSRN